VWNRDIDSHVAGGIVDGYALRMPVSEVRSRGDGRYNVYLYGGQALPLGRARRELLQKLLGGMSGKSIELAGIESQAS
jgi:hypothetical protein